MDKIFVVIPAYNEAANIEDVVKSWLPMVTEINLTGNECKLVFANDGSKDNTLPILRKLEKENKDLIVLDKQNSGHGATVLFLYRFAIDNGCTYVFQTDSDGQTNPSEFYKFWKNRENFDFQIGVRGNRQDGAGRIVVTRVLRMVVWAIFGVFVKDANTPFRLMNADKLKQLLAYIPDDFFLANVALSAAAVKKGYTIGWHDITFRPRQGGVNSINMKRIFKIGARSLKELSEINKNLAK